MGWRGGAPKDVIEQRTKDRDLNSRGLFCLLSYFVVLWAQAQHV